MTIWDAYYKGSIETIPWDKTQAHFLHNLIEEGGITGNSALDLGCGTGNNSIYLAQHGFQKVIGVDIAKKAIFYAQEKLNKKHGEEVCEFICRDTITWLTQNEDTFDFILDWAHIHCLPRGEVEKYAQLVESHLNEKGFFLVRSFAHEKGKSFFEEQREEETNIISCYTKEQLQTIFSSFETVRENKSQSRNKKKEGLYFNELLMRKK